MSGNKTQSFYNRIPRGYYFFGIFCVLFVLLMVSVELNNGKFWTNDLFVYYGATLDYFSGENPYVSNYGLDTGYFKYAPTTLYFFYPSSWIGFFPVQMIHTVFLTISLILSISFLHFVFIYKEDSKKLYGILYVGFALIAAHVAREFHMGNVNLLLLMFFCTGLFLIKKKKNIPAAIFWSLMIVLKPIVILAFIPLLIYKKWKVIFWMAGCGAVFFILPVANSGVDGLIPLWSNWLGAISAHGGYIESENSLKYLLEFYAGIQSNWGASIVFLIVLLGFLLWTIKRKMQIELGEWLVVLLAFCPNFFVTDTEHFLLSLPLLLVLIKYLIELKSWVYWTVFSAFILFFSFNMNDLLGRSISDYFDAMGMLGIANLVFIVLFGAMKTHLFKRNNVLVSND